MGEQMEATRELASLPSYSDSEVMSDSEGGAIPGTQAIMEQQSPPAPPEENPDRKCA